MIGDEDAAETNESKTAEFDVHNSNCRGIGCYECPFYNVYPPSFMEPAGCADGTEWNRYI